LSAWYNFNGMLQTISITISGRVQGVFFRQSAKEKAQAFGIKGKVMNMPDGKVHIIATGSAEQLEKLVAWCKQGPPRAIVHSVQTAELSLQEFDSFTIE
jgi:acylphosphatase